MPVVFDDGIADRNTLIADIGARVITRRGNELTDYVLTLVAERTAKRVVRSSTLQAATPVK
jgi:hypothetical protein